MQHLSVPLPSLSRWMLLDDQNLCIQATSSFVYGAVPIGASIYVVGELDTGELIKSRIFLLGSMCATTVYTYYVHV